MVMVSQQKSETFRNPKNYCGVSSLVCVCVYDIYETMSVDCVHVFWVKFKRRFLGGFVILFDELLFVHEIGIRPDVRSSVLEDGRKK